MKCSRGKRKRSGAVWKLEPDIVLMNPCVWIASLAEHQHESGAARPHVHPHGAQTGSPNTGQAEGQASRRVSRSVGLLFLSHVRDSDGGARTGKENSSPDRFRHTGFLLQPQRHMERPCIYQRRGQPDENGPICRCPALGPVWRLSLCF